VQQDAAGKLDLGFDDLSEQQLKNIARPVRVFRVVTGTQAVMARPGTGPPLPDKPSIAVLPFANMSGDPEQEYFADGMVEEIITALSRIRWLFVIARNSTFTYKGQVVDVKQVGRELGVRYVLEGSVRKAGGRVRITAQLIDATTGTHLWADRFDGSLEDVFDLQERVAVNVAGIIEPALQVAEMRRSVSRATIDLTARLALRAEENDPGILANAAFVLAYLGEDVGGMIGLIDRALALNPSFAGGWYLSGLIRIWAGQHDLAIEHVETSLRLSPRSLEHMGLPLFTMGTAYFFRREFEDAASKLILSVQDNPSHPPSYRFLAACYAHMGRLDEARAIVARLGAITPQVIPTDLPWRNPEDCKLLLSGLRMAAGEA